MTMRRHLCLMLAVILLLAVSSWAQRPGEQQSHAQPSHSESHSNNTPRANGGKIPPPPTARSAGEGPEQEKHPNGRVNETQHVNNNHWYGHDAPTDKRYHVDQPYAHGHFERFGPNYRYNVVRIDRDHREFWLPGGAYFQIADWDWSVAADWCWNCGDDFVVYEDPDHAGWYLLYNVHTGAYVHITYLGT